MTRVRFHLLKVGHCSHPECVAMRGGAWRSTLFPALCGLILHPARGWILYDTGYSSHFRDATAPFPERLYRWTTPVVLPPEQALLAQLKRLGIAAADIGHVIISHLHGDHVAGLKDFPNARFIVLRAEWDALRASSRVGALLHAMLPALLPADFAERVSFADDLPRVELGADCLPFDTGFDLFGDGSLTGVPLPGHTQGQLGLVLRGEDERRRFLLADACWNLKALNKGQAPTWLAARLFANRVEYGRTFERLRRLAASSAAPLLIPSHCNASWEAHGHDAA